jgi:hypothetical protein
MKFAAITSKIGSLLGSHIQFLAKAFSEKGTPSASRMLAIPHTFAAIFVLVYLAIKTHTYPGIDTATGLGAFATAPYAVNRVSNMFGGQKVDREGGVNVTPSKSGDTSTGS